MPGILFVLAILSAAPDAATDATSAATTRAADSPTSAPPPSVQDLSRPYQGQILLADAVGWGVTLVGLAGAGPFAFLGMASLVLAAPLVHSARGHPGRALASFALRSGGWLIGGFLGASTSQPSADGDSFEALGRFAVGSMVGLAVASLVDISVLSGGTRKAAGPQPAGGAAPLTLVPLVAPTPGGGLLGVAAVF